MNIATQTFGLEKEFTADLTGTIQALHNAGFQAIEPLLLFDEKQGKRSKNLWALDTLKTAWEKMQSLDMEIPSVHIGVGFGWLTMPVNLITKNILMLHKAYGIRDYVISAPFGTLALAKHWAKLAANISDAITPHGCRVLYHNHDDEFQSVRYQGKTVEAMEAFLDLTSPDVLLQVDIGWAGMAGEEADIVKRYAAKIASLHLKDFYPKYRNSGYTRKNMPTEAFAPIGKGAIATEKILSMSKELPDFSGNIIIDQDKSVGSMLEALKIGRGNISAILAGEGAS